MTGTTHNSEGRRAVAVLALTVALFAASRGTARAQSNDAFDQPSLVGTWTVQVTLRDCTTNAPIGAPFNSLVTFHHDGTLSESAGSVAFAPGQRGDGHGSWTRRRGHAYRQEMIALVLFDNPAEPAGDANLRSDQTCFSRLLRRLADRHPHGPVYGPGSHRVGRDQRLPQSERRVVSQRLFDSDGSALLAKS